MVKYAAERNSFGGIMSSVFVKNFGPIKEGSLESGGWIDFSRVTAFCGPQGSGKSSVAKTYAFFSWLEKVLTRGDQRESAWVGGRKFPKSFVEFHNVGEYFRPETVLGYRGASYSFMWKNGEFEIVRSTEVAAEYLMPKIMYVPAERNFMSVIEAVDRVKNIPQNLKAVTREFLDACRQFSDGIELPVNGFSFKYDKLNRIGRVVLSDGSSVRLSAASSGLQSMAPLFLVSEYLYRQMLEEKDPTKSMSLAAYRQMMDNVLNSLSIDELPDAISQGVAQFSAALTKRFINIVEEPEQNLFPTSQQKILFKLLEYVKGTPKFLNNQLVLTTHSPYLVEYLKLVAQAAEHPEMLGDVSVLRTGLSASSLVRKEDMLLYETKSDGTIRKLVGEDGFWPDSDVLHAAFDDISDDYASILERQDGQFPNG